MRVPIVRVPAAAWPKESIRELAITSFRDGKPVEVKVQAAWESDKVVGHEIGHCHGLDHHPWWHFCLMTSRVWTWWTWRHAQTTRAEAQQARREGFVELGG